MEPGITKTQSIILGSGRSIYKQPIDKNRGSPHWYARVHMKIGSRYTHTRSTGTTDTKKAIKFAEEFYGQCLVARNQPQLTTSHQVGGATPGLVYRFDKIVDEWLNGKQSAGGGARAAKDFNEARKLCSAPNGPCAFFKRMDIRTIKTDAIRRYLAFAEEHSKRGQLAKTTQRNHLTTLSSIFKFAVERDYLAAVPMMPKLRLEDNPIPNAPNDRGRGTMREFVYVFPFRPTPIFANCQR